MLFPFKTSVKQVHQQAVLQIQIVSPQRLVTFSILTIMHIAQVDPQEIMVFVLQMQIVLLGTVQSVYAEHGLKIQEVFAWMMATVLI